MMRRSVWASLVAGGVTAVAYGCLVGPGFTPVSHRYETSLHGPHEHRLVSGWRVEQHKMFQENIVVRLAAPRAVVELPPLPARYPWLLRLNLKPYEGCRYAIAVNDTPVGTVRNTVYKRGEKFSFLVPAAVMNPQGPNWLIVSNETPETSTEWEWIEIRNYRSAIAAMDWYLLAAFEDRPLWWHRVHPMRLAGAGGLMTAVWLFLAALQRRRTWWVLHGLLWGVALAAFGITARLGTPAVASTRGFWLWWFEPAALTALGVYGVAPLGARWIRLTVWLERLLPYLPEPKWILVWIVAPPALTVMLIGFLLAAIWRWLRRDLVTHAFVMFAGLLGVALVCTYIRWAVLADWLGTFAFGSLLISLSAAIHRAIMRTERIPESL